MKRKIYLYIVLIGLLLPFSCKKDETKVQRNTNATAPTIMSPSGGSSLTLTKADSAKLIRFAWNAADFGFSAAVGYTVQIDTAGNNFKNASNILNATIDSASIIVYELDQKLLAAGFPQNKASSIDVRVRGILSGLNNSPYADTVYSNPVTLSITTFKIGKTYPKILWVVGDFQSWNNTDAAPTLSPVDSTQGTYEGYINIPSLKFKIVSDHSWSNSATYGDDGTNGGTADNGILSQVNGGKDIIIKDYGFLKINVDLQKMTYSTSANTWSITGGFNGWALPGLSMTLTPSTSIWTVTTNLAAGDTYKFIANGGWALNYGDTGADGIPDINGANISVATAGNYTITLDLSKYPYSCKAVKN